MHEKSNGGKWMQTRGGRERGMFSLKGATCHNSEWAGVLVTVVMATVTQTQETVGGDDVTRATWTCKVRKIKMYMCFFSRSALWIPIMFVKATNWELQENTGLLTCAVKSHSIQDSTQNLTQWLKKNIRFRPDGQIRLFWSHRII